MNTPFMLLESSPPPPLPKPVKSIRVFFPFLLSPLRTSGISSRTTQHPFFPFCRVCLPLSLHHHANVTRAGCYNLPPSSLDMPSLPINFLSLDKTSFFCFRLFASPSLSCLFLIACSFFRPKDGAAKVSFLHRPSPLRFSCPPHLSPHTLTARGCKATSPPVPTLDPPWEPPPLVAPPLCHFEDRWHTLP